MANTPSDGPEYALVESLRDCLMEHKFLIPYDFRSVQLCFCVHILGVKYEVANYI